MSDIQSKIAKQVDDLVRVPATMEHFRKKIEEYGRLNEEYQKASETHENEYKEHCKNILARERLRDKTAGPPEKNWQWREEVEFEMCFDDPGKHYEKEIHLCGWFPSSKITVRNGRIKKWQYSHV